MCGIYGEFFNNRKLSSKEEFLIQNDLNFERGPNMSGYWSNGQNIQLGFRRLSILDLSEKGNQPMCSLHGKYSMVFNGEIYNFRDLKVELMNHNYTFNSSSDSEVLVNYFECFGLEKTLSKIDGMFAIALFNHENDKLTLIRDFAGIKPLHYSIVNNDIVFGSRYDQIAKHPNFKQIDIDKEVLTTYLKLHYIPAPYGILENTYQLEPGEYIQFDKRGVVYKKKYWEFPDLNKEELITDKEEAIDLVEKALKRSVKDQLVADVPLGTFLSGGVDSPLVAFAAKSSKKDIKAFTIGSDSRLHDESEDAKKHAHLIGVELELKKMTSLDAKKVLKKCMKHLQEPFADFSVIPTYELTKNAVEDYKVMLSGDGGDELFFGYERFNSVAKNFSYKWIPNKLRYLVYGIDKVLFNNKHVNGCFLENQLSHAHQGLHSRVSKNDIDLVFPKLKSKKSKKIPCYQYSEKKSKLDLYHDMRKAEFYGMMQKTLTKVDRMSMANSLEVRLPFLQKTFIESAVKIHPKLSTGEGKKKQILKDLLRFQLPDAPIDNRKRGFSVPLGKWLKEELKEEFKGKLFDDNFIQKLEIDKNELIKIWELHQSDKKDYKWFLFTLYSLQQWLENLKK